MNYAFAIRHVRIRRQVTAAQLARLSGLSQASISMIESQARRPGPTAQAAIAKALRVPVPLLGLFAAEKDDLNGVSPEAARTVADQLLDAIISQGELSS